MKQGSILTVVRSFRFWGVVLAVLVTLIYSSCGDGDEFNLFQPIAEPIALENDKKAKLEEARVLMDKQDYEGAVDLLDPMIDSKDDSNEARLLFAAAKLGEADLDVWSIISKILEENLLSGNSASLLATQESSGSGGGIDAIFDSFTETFLGTGTARQNRINALAEALSTLLSAPDTDDKKVLDTGCLFAGLLSVPTLNDVQEGLNDTLAGLNSIKNAATDGGSNCPNIDDLGDGTAKVASASANFSLIMAAAANCPFLDLDETSNLMNSVEEQLSLMLENADKGCDEVPQCPPSLPSCDQLFPACVQTLLEVGPGNDAAAGDKRVDSCELILHCTDSSVCFE